MWTLHHRCPKMPCPKGVAESLNMCGVTNLVSLRGENEKGGREGGRKRKEGKVGGGRGRDRKERMETGQEGDGTGWQEGAQGGIRRKRQEGTEGETGRRRGREGERGGGRERTSVIGSLAMAAVLRLARSLRAMMVPPRMKTGVVSMLTGTSQWEMGPSTPAAG